MPTAPDIIIRGGLVVDGSGREPVRADVAITDDRIVEVGRVEAVGRREIDAAGAVVAPGFVDIHTHYDGQATWDRQLAPSSLHGVTTVVMGNCGVGFAPVRERDHDRLIDLMEGVEDIPGVALHEGLTWEWESFPEYLDYLDARTYDIDLAAQIPHSALRVYAMGERAAARVSSTEVETLRMAEMARAAIEAGALGFSTSRTMGHKSTSGELIPSYDAGGEELLAIVRAVGRSGQGVVQLVDDFLESEEELELIRRLAAESGRPVSVSLAYSSVDALHYRDFLSFLDRANSDGLSITAQSAVRGIGILMGLENTLHPFMTNPVWRELADLPVEFQLKRMREPEMRERILTAQTAERDPNLIGGRLIYKWEIMYPMQDPPNYEPHPSTSIAAQARSTGRTPEEIAYDVMVSHDGPRMLCVYAVNYVDGNLDAVHEMLSHPHTLPGLSDGGAHVGSVCDASFPTTLLTHWTRDRAGERLSLSYAIQRQCRDTARAVGLLDRGVLAPGYRADINVIDMDRLSLGTPRVVYDLPAGGRRMIQEASGYLHTFVAGVETHRDGKRTGATPGRLVRGAQPDPRR